MTTGILAVDADLPDLVLLELLLAAFNTQVLLSVMSVNIIIINAQSIGYTVAYPENQQGSFH